MAKSARRFYQLSYPIPHKPIWMEDIGNVLSLSGLVLQGMGQTIVALTPAAIADLDRRDVAFIQPDIDEWSEILRQSDDPVFFEEIDESGIYKAMHRKVRYAISGAVQQRIWVRDKLTCLFCLRKMGDVQLTVDHFIPLELGGKNDETNYLTMCRRCNKDKGNMPPEDFCAHRGIYYDQVVEYIKGKRGFYDVNFYNAPGTIRENDDVMAFLAEKRKR